MRIFHHSHSKSQLKSFTLIELLMMIIFFARGDVAAAEGRGRNLTAPYLTGNFPCSTLLMFN